MTREVDLRNHAPRSPDDELVGLVLLPRTIDKVRAKLANSLGFYRLSPGLSVYLLNDLGVDEETFIEVVRVAENDEAIGAWILARSDVSTFPSINKRLRERAIMTPERFAEILPRYPMLAERPELRNWFEILKLDDLWTFDPAHPERRTLGQA